VTVQDTCTLDHPAAIAALPETGLLRRWPQKKETVHPLSFAERSASVMRPLMEWIWMMGDTGGDGRRDRLGRQTR